MRAKRALGNMNMYFDIDDFSVVQIRRPLLFYTPRLTLALHVSMAKRPAKIKPLGLFSCLGEFLGHTAIQLIEQRASRHLGFAACTAP